MVVNDGFNTGITRFPGTIIVPGKAPQLVFQGGDTTRTLNTTQPLILSAIAIDPEDGLITRASAFTWTSDKTTAVLGTGDELVLEASQLEAGTHNITLHVVDSENMSSEKTVAVAVSR